MNPLHRPAEGGPVTQLVQRACFQTTPDLLAKVPNAIRVTPAAADHAPVNAWRSQFVMRGAAYDFGSCHFPQSSCGDAARIDAVVT
jgi:hypothetical protein